ncbi:MAG: hypothetical protein M9954_07435 [Cyclobacteriaceae bacterium]|nr:hypothetical protein [Cyclobacteriaceae bacterium]MCB0498510.1 hypothetical protein [Cyclobacteriaceae bacterium]MCB9236923.1 hypothetical protein [Flammeovirgaceae bacterium]MCO5271474.1 hypothetical protein [Cyclobacteriaceae bacterium]MCW5901370.1 hypothetical protein [Cyclobacteriaceae bacterium]
MKKISQATDDLLMAYLEGSLSGEERVKVKNGLAGSVELCNRLETLRLVRHALQAKGLSHPSPDFTNRVMKNLGKMPASSMLTPKNGLILLIGVLVAMGMGASLADTGAFNFLNGMLPLNQIKLPTGVSTPALPAIPLNGKLIINSIIALNLGLAFLLLDRTILRPFFNRRSRMHL